MLRGGAYNSRSIYLLVDCFISHLLNFLFRRKANLVHFEKIMIVVLYF